MSVIQYNKVPKDDTLPLKGKMVNPWSFKKKILLFLVALGVYIYVIMFLRTIYLKNQRLERIGGMVEEAKKTISNIHRIDNRLGKKLERLGEILSRDY